MINFERLWRTMNEKGVSTYTLREKCGTDSKTVIRLKTNENIETKTIEKLCSALDCKINYPPKKLDGFFFVLNLAQKTVIILIIGCCQHIKTRGGFTVY